MTPNDVTTTGSKFPVIDITHKPKRQQGQNFPKNEMTTTVSLAGVESDVPLSITLEKAITYYESHAEGEFANLYNMTAIWLRKLLTKNQSSKTNVSGDLLEITAQVVAGIQESAENKEQNNES